MKASHKTIDLIPKEQLEFINLTEEVKNFVGESGIKEGLVNIQSMHTTASIMINEDEPLLKEDLKIQLERLMSQKLDYQHDNFSIRTVNMNEDERVNGHSHCKAMLMQTSITLNVVGGELQLGQWQQIFFLELDGSRPRKVQIQVIGE